MIGLHRHSLDPGPLACMARGGLTASRTTTPRLRETAVGEKKNGMRPTGSRDVSIRANALTKGGRQVAGIGFLGTLPSLIPPEPFGSPLQDLSGCRGAEDTLSAESACMREGSGIPSSARIAIWSSNCESV